MHAVYFAEHVLEHGTEGCNYLLAVDIDMNTVDGYAISSWDRGYGDFEFALDLQTIRLLPHQPGAAMVQCDLVWLDHTPVRQSPRTILQAQLDRVAERGLRRPGRHRAGVHRLRHQLRGRRHASTTATWCRSTVQRRLLDPGRRPGRAAAAGDPQHHVRRRAGRRVGQGGVQLRPARDRLPLRRRADHRRQPRRLQDRGQGDRRPAGQSITFMAKYNEREGNSCHIHLSLRGSDGSTGLLGRPGPRRPLYDSFVAGLLATMADFTLLYAPNINSYKRFAAGQLRPDHDRLGHGQPDLRASGWSATGRAPGWRTGSRARTSTPTWPWPPCSPAACTASRTSSSWVRS